ncbi:MAG: autotransporter-associated beta strand repeat-containing protein, partial [Prosthecobacter sp.]|nr:autotransporter-associated beta strand repeat-containing protein [Prosthecobacter sp.]
TGSNASAWAIFDSGNLHFDGGVLQVTESLSLNAARTIYLGGNGGTLRVDPGKTLTINGYISGEYNHVYSANGYNQSNSLGNAWDASYVRNPDLGDLIIDGGGRVVITGAPDGTVRGNMFNSYGGITWINEGILRLSSAGSSAGAGSLGTNNSFVDSTVIGAQGTLELNTTSDATIQEWFTLNGTGYEDGGTFRTLGTARVYRLAGQVNIQSDAVFHIMNGSDFRISEGGGDFFGSGNVIRKGNGSFRFYGNNPDWTGQFISASGTSYISSAGNLQGMSGVTLERNSLLLYSAGSTSLDEFRDRLPDDLPISGDGYVRLRMDATGGIHSGIEKVGTITASSGVFGIEYNLGADLVASQPRLQGDYAGWHFTEIVREPGVSIHLRNFDSGTDFAGADFNTGNVTDKAVLRVDIAPTLIGVGDGLSGNAPVVPGFFGGTRSLLVASSDGTSQRFDEAYTAFRLVTMDTDGAGNNYLRPLVDSEYKTVGNPDGATTTSVSLESEGLTADQNLRIVGRTSDSLTSGQLSNIRQNSILTLNLPQTVNSLSFNSETYVVNTLANPSGSSTFGGDFTALHLGEGATLTVASGMIQTANFGVLDRGGISNNGNANLDLRSQINGGKLDFAGQEAQIYVGGFFTRYNTSGQINGYEGIDSDNTQLTISSSIVNTNGLVKTGPGSLNLTGDNSYTGNTYINQGNLYLRSDFALGQSTDVFIEGAGGLVVSDGVTISNADAHIGNIYANNIGIAFERGATWGGNIILDNVDSSGSTGYTRNFIPRIYINSTNIGSVLGDIYGGSESLAGAQGTESRIFTTYTGAGGILDIRGQIKDSVSGAVGSPLTSANQNQVLRMEVIATTNEANVQLWQSYDSAGQIILKRGYLRYSGTGDFYTAAAASALNPDNAMSGFHMGGRGLIASNSTDGLTTSNLAFVLANEGSTFNLSSWTVGGDVTDPENLFGSGNWGLGNTTGNSMIGGENRSGEVVFGTGTGSIKFTPYTSVVNRDLRLYAAPGGEVTIRANFVDGGTVTNAVNTSITKIGAGQVNLQGSSAGAGTVEGVNVLGGLLVLEGYDVNADRRIGLNASLLMGGGVLALDNGGLETFGTLTLNAGGSAIAAIGTGQLEITSLGSTNAGSSLHFQSIAGGTIKVGGLADGTRLGSYATFGLAASSTPSATDWAAVNASGEIVAYTGYSDDTLGAGLQTNLIGSSIAAGTTDSVRINTPGAAFTSGTLTLNDGGLLLTSNYTGGTPIAAGVGVTTAGGKDLIVHNYATAAATTIAGNITGNQNVVFTGVGETVLTGTNSYVGTTYVTGAATLTMDTVSRLGTGALGLNGGTIKLTDAGTSTLSSNITLGSGDGTIQVDDPSTVLVLRGVISSEANPVASITTNPNSGGLRIVGSGTVQFGSRTDGSNLVGVNNTYTGLTILGDGVNPLKIDLQGGGNSNAQHAAFGTTDSWTDGTIVKNNVTIEYAPEYVTNNTSQVRYREWMQFGEQAGDQIYLNHTTQRQIAMDGFYNIIGDLNIRTQSASLPGGGTGNRDFLFLPNEGGVFGSGDIVKTGAGNLYLYNSYMDWTGDLDLREGLTIQSPYPGAALESTGKILMGDPDGISTSTIQYRIQARYGNSTTAIDSGRQRFVTTRDISVRDNLKQEIRIGGSYSPESTFDFTGDIYLGAGSTAGGATSSNHVRFYYEDTTGYDGSLIGHQQHVLMNFAGNLSGSNNLMLDANEGNNPNDDANDQFVTFLFSGDNSNYTGKLTIGSEQGTGTNNFDRDDNDIFRVGSDKALTSANVVEMRNLTTFQAGGQSVTIGGLSTNDGSSTSGLYSFTSPTWDPLRQTTADLDAVNADINATSGTIHGATGTANYSPVGGSSAIIENASATPGTLSIVQNGDTTWDVYFRDGVPSAHYEDSSAAAGALSLEKLGTGIATLSIFNDYTGTTTVSEGALQVGVGGTGEWGFVSQGSNYAVTSGTGGNRAFGSTGTGQTTVMSGATISGTGHVRGDLVVNGTLAPGDAVLGGAGAERGTLFIGDDVGGGNLIINAGAVLSMQISTASLSDLSLQNGTYTLNNLVDYENYLMVMPFSHFSTAGFPTYYGEPGTEIPSNAHDHLEVGNGITWTGGNIDVEAVVGTGAFTPQAGDIYNLFDWYGVSDWGTFSAGSSRYLVGNGDDNGNLNLPDLSAYPEFRWDTGLFTDYGVLVIAIVPEPSRAFLMMLGLCFLVFRRRRN